ncbi:hypothetical protein [Pseudomonas sp. R2-60-08W]|uniref:hypothetical protein n=1 Tax=Pseudomonas sp. R2-60-08W TaxID=1173280 RepID=UPI000F57CB0A|nr:hypothetical protein [Pseudomonas sp. R2-60-08W]AZF24535.1 Putative large exoprotein, ShlA/HecA/FhaA family [Pseudomonas sp. R2-60-08W]
MVGEPEGVLDTVKGIVEAVGSPIETFRALRSVFQSGDVLGNVSDAVKQSYVARVDNLEAEYERAGASGSFNAGRETGKLISDVVALGTGGGGALKSGAVFVEKVTAKVAKVELAGAKGAGAGKAPYTSTVSTDAEAGMPYTRPIKEAGAKATGGAAGKVDEFIPPGMDRPFRPVNPEFPPSKSVVDAMESPQIKNMVGCSGTDCSDIASRLFDASGGKGY